MAIQTSYSLDRLPQRVIATPKVQQRLLLIEDSEDEMLLVRYAIQEYGDGKFRLEWAKGLSEGLDFLSKSQADLVLLDLGLPDSRGPSSYAWIREITHGAPVLVLTADTREETEFELAASGVEDYLVKDQVSGALLVEAIEAALNRANQQRSLLNLAYQVQRRAHWKFDRARVRSAGA